MPTARRVSHAKAARIAKLSGPVEVTTLHPVVEELALFLADGDRDRFKIVSRTCVIVLNNPRRPKWRSNL